MFLLKNVNKNTVVIFNCTICGGSCVVERGANAIRRRQKEKQPMWVAFFLCCAANLDATPKKSIKSRDFGI